MRGWQIGIKAGTFGIGGLVAFFCFLSSCYAFDNSQLFKDAENGDREAQYTLAHQYLKGRGGLPKDHEKAVQWLGKSADRGHKDAAFGLAILYLEGTAVDQNRSQALYRMKQAAESGHEEAQYILGMAYWKSEPEKAAGWLAKAAQSGRLGAAENLELLCGEKPSLSSCRDNR